jgi:hypothetical protein
MERSRSLHLLQTDSLVLSATANDWLTQLGGKSTQLVLRRFETPLDIVKKATAAARSDATHTSHTRNAVQHYHRPRFGKKNFRSPTQAAERGRWKQAHQRRRPRNAVQHHHRPRFGKKNYRRQAHQRQRPGARTSSLPRLRPSKTTNEDAIRKKRTRFRGRPKTKGETSGDFYRKRGLLRQAMEEEHQLSLLSARRVRMEKKLEETIVAYRFMSQAYGKSVQVLEGGGETLGSGRRTYPKLLAHMERNRLRTQKLMANMTAALEQARREENSFINACAFLHQ